MAQMSLFDTYCGYAAGGMHAPARLFTKAAAKLAATG